MLRTISSGPVSRLFIARIIRLRASDVVFTIVILMKPAAPAEVFRLLGPLDEGADTDATRPWSLSDTKWPTRRPSPGAGIPVFMGSQCERHSRFPPAKTLVLGR